jgi:hypothetical protein
MQRATLARPVKHAVMQNKKKSAAPEIDTLGPHVPWVVLFSNSVIFSVSCTCCNASRTSIAIDLSVFKFNSLPQAMILKTKFYKSK